MADEGFKLAGAYVEVELKDDTDTSKIRARIQAEPAVELDTKLADPDVTKTRAETQSKFDADPVKIPAKVDKDSVDRSAQDAGTQGGSVLASALGIGVLAGGPVVGAAMVGIGVAGLTALGVTLEKGNPVVQAGWNQLALDAKTGATKAAASIVPPVADALGQLDRLVVSEQPRLKSMFTGAAADIKPLTDGLVGLAQNALPGLDNALTHSLPIAQGLANVERDIGTAIGNVGNAVAGSSNQIGGDLSAVGTIVTTVGHGFGDLIGITSNLAQGALPAVQGVLGTVVGTLDDVEHVLGPIGPGIGAIAAAGLIAVPVFKGLATATEGWAASLTSSSLLGGVNNLITSTTGITGGLGGLARGIPYVGVAVAGLSALTGILSAKQNAAAQAADAQAQSSDRLNDALNNVQHATRAQIDNAVAANAASVLTTTQQSQQIDTNVKLNQVLSASGVTQQQFITGVEQGGTALANVKSKLDGYVDSQNKASADGKDLTDTQISTAQSASALSGQLGNLNTAFKGSAAATQLASAPMSTLVQKEQDAVTKTQNLSTQVTNLQTLLKNLADHGTESARDSVSTFNAGIDQLTQQLRSLKGPLVDANGDFNLTGERGRDAMAGIEAARNSMVDYATQAKAADIPASQINSTLNTMRNRFVGTLEQMGLNASEAKHLADQYGLIPRNIQTKIGISAVDNAQAVVAKYQRLNGKTISTTIVRVNGEVDVGGMHGFADGGLVQRNAGGNLDSLTPMSSSVPTIVPPNTWRVVGDNMSVPELYAPLNGSQRTRDLITMAAQREGIPVGSAGTTVQITNNITQLPQEDGLVLAARVSAQDQWALTTIRGG